MNKKGFTLIELLAVILILGIIMLIAIPVANKVVRTAKRGAVIATTNNIIKAAEQACEVKRVRGEDGRNTYVIVDGKVRPSLEIKGDLLDYAVVSVNSDCNADIYAKDTYFIIKKSYDSDEIVASDIEDFDNKFSFDESIDETYLGIVYFDPTDATKVCKAGDKNKKYSANDAKSGCMRWYIFNDNHDGTVDAILDHSFGPGLWRVASDDDKYAPSTKSGSILYALKEATKGWTVIEDRKDSYTGSYLNHKYTINYSGYKARLITAEEIARITGNSKFDVGKQLDNYKLDTNTQEGLPDISKSKYLWIVNGDDGGLWTASATNDNNDNDSIRNKNIWILSNYSISLGLDFPGVTPAYRKARPVVTIPKSLYK